MTDHYAEKNVETGKSLVILLYLSFFDIFIILDFYPDPPVIIGVF